MCNHCQSAPAITLTRGEFTTDLFCSWDCLQGATDLTKLCINCSDAISVPIQVIDLYVDQFCSEKCLKKYVMHNLNGVD